MGASYLEVNYRREICGRWIFSPTRDMSKEEDGAASENDLEIMAPHISLRPTTSYFPEKWGKLLILQKWFKLAVSDKSSTPRYIFLKKFDILFQSVFYSMSVDLEHFKLLKEVPEIKKEIKKQDPFCSRQNRFVIFPRFFMRGIEGGEFQNSAQTRQQQKQDRPWGHIRCPKDAGKYNQDIGRGKEEKTFVVSRSFLAAVRGSEGCGGDIMSLPPSMYMLYRRRT